MKSNDIRQSFLDYFSQRGHRVHPSAPLVPHGDPTLLFTNAGMVPFKEYFLGVDKPDSVRAVSVQKCMRVSGKHNDLENVGPSPHHHTFFEMLGNFSFGDYFKAEAIRFGWELVTEVWGIPSEHLSATVFEQDDEAAELWAKLSDLPDSRIHRAPAKDNFWAMGDTGPCGPCSEIFVDVEPGRAPVSWDEGTESGRYLEIWNLVFMQFDRDETGEIHPLPEPSIDTGAGLERVAAVLQGVASNYDTDLFRPTLDAVSELSGIVYGRDPESDVDFRVIADHLRAGAFLLADGVIPSNEGRGYVLRRVLRRAVRHGMRLGFEEPFLHRLLPAVTASLGGAYPELGGAEKASGHTVEEEEGKFLSTVATASRQVQDAIDAAHHEGVDRLEGETVFRLYDTYGLPLEMIREIAEEEQVQVDEEGFERALTRQRQRSRDAAGEGQQRLAAVRDALKEAHGPNQNDFVGYDELELEDARVEALALSVDGGYRAGETVAAGASGVAILDKTPFYAESGGQLGDRGELVWEGGRALVSDTQKGAAGTFYHFLEVVEGELPEGTRVSALVDPDWRRPTQRNHTATHLLHLALRHVLGEGVRQAGSLVAPDRLRFDFTYGKPVTSEELVRIEELVNRWVLEAEGTNITPDRGFEEAVSEGAMALFGEKYGDRVRTVEVPALSSDSGEGETLRSLELCGGCHVGNTGEIGLFLITMERGVASGVRRIEAITGEGARRQVFERRDLLQRITSELGVPVDRAAEEIADWRQRTRELERELAQMRMKLVTGVEAEEETVVDGVKVVSREVPSAPVNEIRNMADVLRGKLGSGVVVLGSRGEGKVSLVTAVSSDLIGRVHAGRLAKEIATLVGGSGGGRPDFAQAGGKEPEKLPEALARVPELVRESLAR